MGKCIAIATWSFGEQAVDKAGDILSRGGPAIDAVEQGINVAELDAGVVSVGFGGMPNAAGVMEVDAAVMDGRSHAVGAVAGLQQCRTPISVARKVLEACPHPMLVGEGARTFADQHGFAREDALSKDAAEKYRQWLGGENAQPTFMHDTIGLLARDQHCGLVAGCSTSGMAFKHPGRVGDSPLVGGGLYADSEAGAAAATGNGDEILRFCMSYAVVEHMRHGDDAAQACEKVILRYVRMHPEKIDEDVSLIALSAKGEYGAATLREKFVFAVWGEQGSRCEGIERPSADRLA